MIHFPQRIERTLQTSAHLFNFQEDIFGIVFREEQLKKNLRMFIIFFVFQTDISGIDVK